MHPARHSRAPASLDARQLSYSYASRAGTAFELSRVSATMPRGSVTGLLGPNGSGKSTLLKILAGILRPASGEVLIDGEPLAALSRRDAARRIALVPQSTHPAFDFTCRELVLMGRHPHLAPFELEGPADFAIADRAMRDTETTALADRLFLTLSGGEQQRVALASALAQSPDVLLLDEPTTSLDLAYQLDIAAMLARINRAQGVTMVIATHDLNLAARLCDRLVLLRDGQLIGQGDTAAMLTAENVGALYGVDAEIETHRATGRLIVVPVRRRTS